MTLRLTYKWVLLVKSLLFCISSLAEVSCSIYLKASTVLPYSKVANFMGPVFSPSLTIRLNEKDNKTTNSLCLRSSYANFLNAAESLGSTLVI